MKSLIDALKGTCQSKEELIQVLRNNLPKQTSQEALRKRCERFLKRFEAFGLVEQRGDKYCWYIYINLLKNREVYLVELKHSRQLIPALRQIAGMMQPRYSVAMEEEYVSPEEAKILVKCAEDHLTAYPKIYGFLEDYRGKMEKTQRRENRFIDHLMKKLREELGEPAKTNKAIDLLGFVRNNLPKLIYQCIRYDYSPHLQLEGDKIWFGNSLVAKIREEEKESSLTLFDRVRRFVEDKIKDGSNITEVSQIRNDVNRVFEAQQRLQQEIQKLILRIKSDEPLIGGCDTCPKVYLSNTEV